MTQPTTYSVSARTKERILRAGLSTWPLTAYRTVAAAANVSPSTVKYHFKSPSALRLAIANFAVDQDDKRVMLHLIAENHASVSEMSDLERAECYSN